MPWRELTFENMFDKAKQLKKVDRETIRYSKYIPLGKAGSYEDETKQKFQSKM